MIKETMVDFQDSRVSVEEIVISKLLDEFFELYKNNTLLPNEQIECLEFINTLFRLKHKFIIDYNKEKRSFARDTQMYHLKKIQLLAKMRIKKVYKPSPGKKYEPTEEVLQFRELIRALNKKAKDEISAKTKKLLDELMRERWTVRDKTALLREILNTKDAKFQDLLESKDKEEIITSFLALLDLKRKNEITVIQERNFGEIIITKG